MRTEHETDKCPRRYAIEEPLVPLVHRLYAHTGGQLGLDVFDRPVWIANAFDVVADAVNFRRGPNDDG